MMRNISGLVNVHWFLGVPFNDTNWRLQIVETGQAILGNYLIGIQAGNEPDLYANHGRRPTVSLLSLGVKMVLNFWLVVELHAGRLLRRVWLTHPGARRGHKREGE